MYTVCHLHNAHMQKKKKILYNFSTEAKTIRSHKFLEN